MELDRINILVTDGAPAMSGQTRGLSARLADVAPQLRSRHCLIHQSLLCAKLKGELKETIDSVMAITVLTSFVLRPAYSTAFSASCCQTCQLNTEVMRFVNDPFCVDVVGEFAMKAKELVVSLNEACLQLELIDIQSSADLRQSLQLAGSEKFWTPEIP